MLRNTLHLSEAASMSRWPLPYLRYLAVPARPVPLVLVVVFSVGLTFASFGGLLGLPLLLILWSWTFKYGFITFDAVSRGFSEPPVLSLEMVNPVNEQRPLGMLAIVLVFFGATLWLQKWVGPVAVGVLRMIALVLLPASVAALAVTGRLLDAVNPKLLFTFMLRLGRDYVLLLVVIVAIAVLNNYIETLPLWDVIDQMLSLYALFAIFSLMGGMVYERRDELGVDAWEAPERTAERDEKAERRAFDRELDAIYSHVRAGAIDQAWLALETHLVANDHAFETYRRYYDRLATWPDSRLKDRLAREWVTRHGERASAAMAHGRAGAR